MINIAIVDDNRFYINDIRELLAENMERIGVEYKVTEYSDADSFLKAIEILRFDIVFLDIVLDKDNGIELGMRLNDKQPDADIIFVSAHPEYFEDVYKVSHSYFLMKDFNGERFADSVARALKHLKREIITIHIKNNNYTIRLNDVMYFESYMKHTRVLMSSGEIIQYSINIKEIEAYLPKNSFVRTHQSFIVNMKHIKSYGRQKIFMGDGKEVPISRKYINSVREKISFFLGGVI